MLKIAITGATGRMGLAVIRAIAATKGTQLAAALTRPDSTQLGKDAGQLAGIDLLGVRIISETAKAFKECDAVIDFTRPEAMVTYAKAAAKAGATFISGTTGMTKAQEKVLSTIAKEIPVVWAANMSVGVTLLQALVEKAAATLGPEYDLEILEMHHRRKEDAPSGTALALGRAAAKGRGVDLEKVRRLDREGARKLGDIGFAVLRGGGVIGAHEVILAGEQEVITLGHQAMDRDVFASGALRAAKWAANKKPGLYTMQDVLGL